MHNDEFLNEILTFEAKLLGFAKRWKHRPALVTRTDVGEMLVLVDSNLHRFMTEFEKHEKGAEAALAKSRRTFLPLRRSRTRRACRRFGTLLDTQTGNRWGAEEVLGAVGEELHGLVTKKLLPPSVAGLRRHVGNFCGTARTLACVFGEGDITESDWQTALRLLKKAIGTTIAIAGLAGIDPHTIRLTKEVVLLARVLACGLVRLLSEAQSTLSISSDLGVPATFTYLEKQLALERLGRLRLEQLRAEDAGRDVANNNRTHQAPRVSD